MRLPATRLRPSGPWRAAPGWGWPGGRGPAGRVPPLTPPIPLPPGCCLSASSASGKPSPPPRRRASPPGSGLSLGRRRPPYCTQPGSPASAERGRCGSPHCFCRPSWAGVELRHWARTLGRPPPSGGFFPVRLVVWAPAPEGSTALSRHRRTCRRSPRASGAGSAPPLPDVRGWSDSPGGGKVPAPRPPAQPRPAVRSGEAGRSSGCPWGPAPPRIGGVSSCPLSGQHKPLPAAWAFLESGGA